MSSTVIESPNQIKVVENKIGGITINDERQNETELNLLVKPVKQILELAEVGRAGLPGRDGIDGDKTFPFDQGIPSASWIINHGLNKFPSVTVVDSGGSEVEGDIQYLDINSLIVQFSASFSGKAYLN